MTDFGHFLINNMRSNLEPSELHALENASQYHMSREATSNAVATTFTTSAADLSDPGSPPPLPSSCFPFKTIKEEEELSSVLLAAVDDDSSHEDDVNESTTLSKSSSNCNSSNISSSSSQCDEQPTTQTNTHSLVAQLVDDNNYLVARDTPTVRVHFDANTNTQPIATRHQSDRFVIMNPIYETEFEKSDHNFPQQQQQQQNHRQPQFVNKIDFKTTNVYEEYMDQVNFICPSAKQNVAFEAKTSISPPKRDADLRETSAAAFSFVKMLKSFRTIFSHHHTDCPSAAQPVKATTATTHRFLNGLNGQTNKISPCHSSAVSAAACVNNQSTHSIKSALVVALKETKKKEKKASPVWIKKSMKKKSPVTSTGKIYSPMTGGRQQLFRVKSSTSNGLVSRTQSRRMLNLNLRLKQRQKSQKKVALVVDSKVNKIQQKLAASNQAALALKTNKPAEKSKEKLLVNWDKILKKASTKNPESFKRLIQTNLRGVPLHQQQLNVSSSPAACSKLAGLDNKFKNNNVNNNKSNTVNNLGKSVVSGAYNGANLEQGTVGMAVNKPNKNVNFQLVNGQSKQPVTVAAVESSKPRPKDLNENFRNSLLTILGSDEIKPPIVKQASRKLDVKEKKSQKQIIQKQKKISKIVHKMPLHSISAMLTAELHGGQEPTSASSWTTSSTVLKHDETGGSGGETQAAMAQATQISKLKHELVKVVVNEEVINHRTLPRIPIDCVSKILVKACEPVVLPPPEHEQQDGLTRTNVQMFYFRPESSPRTMMKTRTQKFIKNVCSHLNQTLGRSVATKNHAALDELKKSSSSSSTDSAAADKETLRLLAMKKSIFKTLLKSKQFHNLVPTATDPSRGAEEVRKKRSVGDEAVEYSNNLTTDRAKKDMSKLHRTLNKKLLFHNSKNSNNTFASKREVAVSKHPSIQQFISEYSDIDDIYYNNNIKAKAL